MEAERYNQLFGIVTSALVIAGVDESDALRAAEAACKKLAGFDPQRDLNWVDGIEYKTADPNQVT